MICNVERSPFDLQNRGSVWKAGSLQEGENFFVEHFIGKVVGFSSALLCRLTAYSKM